MLSHESTKVDVKSSINNNNNNDQKNEEYLKLYQKEINEYSRRIKKTRESKKNRFSLE